MTLTTDLYQELILEHNKSPKNFGLLEHPSHQAEGYNPLCGDHYHLYFKIGADQIIQAVSFQGQGCAISKASASIMTAAVKGKSIEYARQLFKEFKMLLAGELDPERDVNILGKLKVFSGIWQYPSRVKCANLAWHALNAALRGEETISTEKDEKDHA